MKRVFLVLLALMFSISLIACEGNKNNTASKTDEDMIEELKEAVVDALKDDDVRNEMKEKFIHTTTEMKGLEFETHTEIGDCEICIISDEGKVACASQIRDYEHGIVNWIPDDGKHQLCSLLIKRLNEVFDGKYIYKNDKYNYGVVVLTITPEYDVDVQFEKKDVKCSR